MCQNDSICIFLTDFFLIRKKFGTAYRTQNVKRPFRCEISDKNAVFIDYYRLIRDKIGVFYCFYLFLGSWHKNCYKDK
ncbi:hypothetical protein HMPREF1325_0057 [Treponema socranskii subsp. socranskii VPI DR56BR1116 = ATCC 35536]|uniref:Uncharacterized protein n=1 Tax=Treponema socranskii subsp. socranskii VPI DR56BR1116 = ATCC 35536 TaxID=1125725 RepID=U1GP11_TRESO|nr:hypothetical protein HMPREF1325_0057 [Treponema socranskii subsp. socranskii VPI DR56BR1116 = ATCC 35536]